MIGPTPHGQVSQIAPIMVQEEMWQRMRALPYAYVAPTLVSVPHARSLFPRMSAPAPPRRSRRDAEFAHIHPHHDGSLHVTLPETAKDEVEAAGWGVRHPQHHSILVYCPRDRAELDVVWRIVSLSYDYALGEVT